MASLADLSAKGDFGAVGNGVSDDTAALNAACAAQAATGARLHIEAGEYLVSTLTYPGHTSSNRFFQGVIYGDYGKTVIKQKASSAGANLWVFNDQSASRVGDLVVRDLAITCEVNKNAGAGLYFYGCARVHLDGILMRGDYAMYDGIEFNGCASMVVRRCTILSPVRDGFVAYSDNATVPGAGLFIDESNLVLSPGRDGLSIRGGIGGLVCDLQVYEAGRYACLVTRSPVHGGTNVRNRDLTFGPNCSFDNPANGSIYFAESAVEMVKISGGWHNAPVPPNTGAAFVIRRQGPGESAGYAGLPATFHFDNVTSRQGNGSAILWEDTGDLKVNGCDFSYRSAGTGIMINPLTSGGVPAQGLGRVEITNCRIVGGAGAGIQAAAIPARTLITGNLVCGNAGGNFVNVPTTQGGAWVGVIANNVAA